MPELVLCELGPTNIDNLESFSPFCLKVHRALKAAGLKYTSRPGAHPGSHKRHNPLEQVPVLLIDGKPVYDSTRILATIEAISPRRQRGLTSAQRNEALLWEELGDTALNGFLVASRWADDANWPRVREAYFGAAPWFVRKLITPRLRARIIGVLVARDVWRAGPLACWERFDMLLDQLDTRAPETGFWVGDELTAADFGIFAQLHALRNDLTPAQRDKIAAHKDLSAYLDRVDAATRTRADDAGSVRGPVVASYASHQAPS